MNAAKKKVLTLPSSSTGSQGAVFLLSAFILKTSLDARKFPVAVTDREIYTVAEQEIFTSHRTTKLASE